MAGKKKNKNKNKKTYPRHTETKYNAPIFVTEARGIVAQINDGIVTLCDKHGVPYPQSDLDMVRSYTGERKTRVVTKALGLETGGNSVGEWTKNFDIVYAADTNTKPIHGGKHNFSIGSVYRGVIAQTHPNGGSISCQRYAAYGWIWSGDYKIEQETWVKAIQKIQTEEPEGKRIGFIIDSDLGNLEAYSNRSMPLLDDFYLPPNFTLLYASADYSDEWTNQMIRMCDKSAGLDLEKNLSVAESLDENTPLYGEILFLEMDVP